MFVDSFKFFKRKDILPDLSTVIDPDKDSAQVALTDGSNYVVKPKIYCYPRKLSVPGGHKPSAAGLGAFLHPTV